MGIFVTSLGNYGGAGPECPKSGPRVGRAVAVGKPLARPRMRKTRPPPTTASAAAAKTSSASSSTSAGDLRAFLPAGFFGRCCRACSRRSLSSARRASQLRNSPPLFHLVVLAHPLLPPSLTRLGLGVGGPARPGRGALLPRRHLLLPGRRRKALPSSDKPASQVPSPRPGRGGSSEVGPACRPPAASTPDSRA